MADTNLIIKKINTGTSTYDIAAKYLTDASGNNLTYESIHEEITDKYDELVGIAQGVIDTYVIPISKGTEDQYKDSYNAIVDSEKHTTDEISVATLASLVVPKNSSGKFKVGDIILMEAESTDGKKAFDRWVSWVNGEGTEVRLTVLESQVAKHHHELPTPQTSKAYVSIKESLYTTTLATVDTETDVVYGASGDVMTGVSYDTNGAQANLQITNVSGSTSVSHAHTIDAHDHSFNPSSLVSDTANVYTHLDTDTYTPHTHGTESVASVQTSDTASTFTYATGGFDIMLSDKEFLVSLTDSDSINTGGASLTTDSNVSGLETYAVKTGESVTVGNAVKTTSSGTHTHTVTVDTGSNVVTSVDYAPNVVTSVVYSPGNVQEKVVTGVTTDNVTVATSWGDAPTSSFVESWSCSVTDGVLSFTTSTSRAVISATTVSTSKSVKVVNTISSDTQSNATCVVTSAEQSASKASVTLTASVGEAGAHQHGFSHTHTLPAHTHDVASHSHTYVKTIASEKFSAIRSFTLSTSSYTPHTHTSVDVAGVGSNGDEFTYVTTTASSLKVDVVKSLISSATVDEADLTMSSEYIGVTGTITMPQLVPDTSALSTLLSTKSIVPAKTADEQAIKSIEFNQGDFVTSVSGYTKENIGGTHNELVN